MYDGPRREISEYFSSSQIVLPHKCSRFSLAWISLVDDVRMSIRSGKDSMTPTAPGVKLTYDDYLLFPDDGKRHELIDGEHFVTPAPNLLHQLILGNLHYMIRHHLETHPVGRVFMAPLDVVFSKFDVVEPDLLYVSKERQRHLEEKWVSGAPDLVVEIASPSTRKRDATIKRRLYERWGVSEYWIVDPKLNVIYRCNASVFERPVELSLEAGEVLTTPLLPGLKVPLERVFDRT